MAKAEEWAKSKKIKLIRLNSGGHQNTELTPQCHPEGFLFIQKSAF